MSSESAKGVGNKAGVLRYYQDAASQLPEPGKEWERSEVGKALQKAMRKFSFHDIIYRQTWGGDSAMWETDAKCYEYVQEDLEAGDQRLPCNHRGLRNLGNGQFTCMKDHCSQTFDRETAERIFS